MRAVRGVLAGDPPPDPRRFALLDLGFRPFYLLAGAYAALAVPLWALVYAGAVGPANPLWHAHEMLYGYTFAVIAGFLFTAVRNWTGRATPRGRALGAIVALWIAGRVVAPLSLPTAALFDLLFAAALAWGIGRPLVASGHRRNYFLIPLVLALGGAGALLRARPAATLAIGLDLVLLLMAVMAGRVVPVFTNNAVAGANARRVPALERAALGSALGLAALDALALAGSPAPGAAAALALFGAAAHGVRLALWAPLAARGRPILWILHLSYAWIVVHLALRGLAGFGLARPELATHALAVGAIGGLTLGMMTRTARGHTARELRASPPEVAAYALVQLAAAVRVLLPLAAPQAYPGAVLASALLWTAAFTLFTIVFLPILTRPRLDGAPG